MSPTPPSISVVIPTFNRAQLLAECLQSVLSQTEPADEVIVVDDGSNDETAETVAGFGSAVRYLNQPNRGVAAARNRGIEAAGSEWIAFLDSDDQWEPQALERLRVAQVSHPNADLIAMRARVLHADGSLERHSRGKKSPGLRFTTQTLLSVDTAGVLTPFARRAVLRSADGFDPSMRSAEDCDLWIRLSFIATLIGIPEALLRRRRHATNLTLDRGLNARMWLRLLRKLEADQPGFVAQNRRLIERTQAKEHLRLGRALLRAPDRTADELVQAKHHLLQSIRLHPWRPRAYSSLCRAWISSS